LYQSTLKKTFDDTVYLMVETMPRNILKLDQVSMTCRGHRVNIRHESLLLWQLLYLVWFKTSRGSHIGWINLHCTLLSSRVTRCEQLYAIMICRPILHLSVSRHTFQVQSSV